MKIFSTDELRIISRLPAGNNVFWWFYQRKLTVRTWFNAKEKKLSFNGGGTIMTQKVDLEVCLWQLRSSKIYDFKQWCLRCQLLVCVMKFEFTPETPFLKQSIWFNDIFPYDEITCIVMHFLFGLEINDKSRSMTTHMPHITRFLYFIRGAFFIGSCNFSSTHDFVTHASSAFLC